VPLERHLARDDGAQPAHARPEPPPLGSWFGPMVSGLGGWSPAASAVCFVLT